MRNSTPAVNAPIPTIMLFQVAALFIRSASEIHLTERGLDSDSARNLSFLTIPLIETLLFWSILKSNIVQLQSILFDRIPGFRLILRSIALGLAIRVCYWSGVFSNAAFGWSGFSEVRSGQTASFWLGCPSLNNTFLAVITMAVVTPIIEEVVNRGLILGTLLERTNTIFAIGLSAGLFAVLHIPETMPMVFVVGIILAIQTIRSKSLLPSIITHAVYNFLAVIDWQCLHGSWNPTHTSTGGTIVGVLAILTGTTAVVCVILLLAKTDAGAKDSPRHKYTSD